MHNSEEYFGCDRCDSFSPESKILFDKKTCRNGCVETICSRCFRHYAEICEHYELLECYSCILKKELSTHIKNIEHFTSFMCDLDIPEINIALIIEYLKKRKIKKKDK